MIISKKSIWLGVGSLIVLGSGAMIWMLTRSPSSSLPIQLGAMNWRIRTSNEKIVFYGRVVDQDGQGVPDVLVNPQIFIEKGLWNQDSMSRPCATDAQGCFEVRASKGKSLQITKLELSGYEIRREELRSFSYSSDNPSVTIHDPDPAHPVLFHVWKKGPTEPLLRFARQFTFGANDPAMAVDLVGGQSGPRPLSEADLLIRVHTNPYPGKEDRGPFDWSLSLEPCDGEIIQSSDPYLYRAPATGYSRSLDVVFSKDKPNWRSQHEKQFYLRGRNGKLYAAITLDIYAYNPNEVKITINSLANPAGSPNLAPSYEKITKVPRPRN